MQLSHRKAARKQGIKLLPEKKVYCQRNALF